MPDWHHLDTLSRVERLARAEKLAAAKLGELAGF